MTTTTAISFYADAVTSVSGKDIIHVHATGVDSANVISNFSHEEVLEALEFSTVADWVAKVLKDEI